LWPKKRLSLVGIARKLYLMAERVRTSNLKLMWVPAPVGIKGNEKADKTVKETLNQEVDNTYKVVKSH
jgi:ribonuclease HI